MDEFLPGCMIEVKVDWFLLNYVVFSK